MKYTDAIHAHPAIRDKALLGSLGFALPALKDPIFVPINPEGVDYLRMRGIKVDGDLGEGNTVIIEAAHKTGTINVRIVNGNNNSLVLQDCHMLNANLSFQGSDNIAIIGKGWYKYRIDLVGNGNVFYSGLNGSAGDVRCTVFGEKRSIYIGEDCMLSWSIDMRTGEAHALIDLATREVINDPRDIQIGPHAWIGHNVVISRGVEIGTGAVVGSCSVVTKPAPNFCAVAGVPARVVRENVTWARAAKPTPHNINALLSRNYMRPTPLEAGPDVDL
jgi:acetyltransferase-like isoleucine patch superfamily enzyme